MPLHLDLKPYERIIIGGVSIRNGDRRSAIYIESQARFLREKDIITESQADTACKRLYLWIQAWYLGGHSLEFESQFMAIANEIMKAVPTMTPYILDIHGKLMQAAWYPAIKAGKELIEYERQLRDIHEQNLREQADRQSDQDAA